MLGGRTTATSALVHAAADNRGELFWAQAPPLTKQSAIGLTVIDWLWTQELTLGPSFMQGQLGGVRVLAALGGRLFGGLFRRADAISAAMTARGFAGASVCGSVMTMNSRPDFRSGFVSELITRISQSYSQCKGHGNGRGNAVTAAVTTHGLAAA